MADGASSITEIVDEVGDNLATFFAALWGTEGDPGSGFAEMVDSAFAGLGEHWEVFFVLPWALFLSAAVKLWRSSQRWAAVVAAMLATGFGLLAWEQWWASLAMFGVVAVVAGACALVLRRWARIDSAGEPPSPAAVATSVVECADEAPASDVVEPSEKVPADVRPAPVVMAPALQGWTVDGALASMPEVSRGRPGWQHAAFVCVVLALVGGASTTAVLGFGWWVAVIVGAVFAVVLFPFARVVWRRLTRRGGEDAAELLMAHGTGVQYANAVVRARALGDDVVAALWLVQLDGHLASHPELDRGVWAPEFGRLRDSGLLAAPALASTG